LNPTVNTGNFVTVNGTNYSIFQPNYIPVFGKSAPIFDQFSDNKGHNFGLQLNVPIFNGFAVRNNIERSKVALERAKIAMSQSRNRSGTNCLHRVH
jgi:outer membrane protein